MGGRFKPKWALYVGGPLDGRRQVMPPNNGDEVVVYEGAGERLRVGHVYRLTDEYRAGAFHEAKARVAVYVRTGDPEPVFHTGLGCMQRGPGER